MKPAVPLVGSESGVVQAISTEAAPDESHVTDILPSETDSVSHNLDGASKIQSRLEDKMDEEDFWAELEEVPACEPTGDSKGCALWSDLFEEGEEHLKEADTIVPFAGETEQMMRARALLQVADECRKESEAARAKLVAAEACELSKEQKKQALLTVFFPAQGDTPHKDPNPLHSLRGKRGPAHPCCQTLEELKIAQRQVKVQEANRKLKVFIYICIHIHYIYVYMNGWGSFDLFGSAGFPR